MNREASTDPTVHRELVVQDPPQEGRDVANLQRALRERLTARGLSDDVPVPVHGKFTHATWVACVEAGYFLGLLSTTYLATDKRRGLATEGAQHIIRNPDDRTDEQRARANERSGQLKRGPRYYDDLAEEQGVSGGRGIEAAFKWSDRYLGAKENPAGSNWGRPVQDWIKLTGYASPVPWCGCFTNAFVIAGGVANGRGWIGYTPAIIAHARAKKGGWTWHGASEGRRGDLALFDTPGGDPAVHVGVVRKKLSDSRYLTREGNTGSSNADGGQVQDRDRSTQGTFRIVGFARPPW